MGLRIRMICGFWLAAALFGQSQPPARIVEPGAPGTAGKVLSPASVAIVPREPSEADVQFMQGMIHHHAQAVEMVALMPGRVRSPALAKFGKRISISQTDEMQFMRQWLADRGKPVPMQHDMSHMEHMNGSGMIDMASMPMMPGMLTPQQMKTLANAKGAKFDRLFLTGMIQHHKGALVMVEDLFNTPGSGEDALLFDFATDVNNTQTAEIKIMQGMLKEKK
ncbi:MAG TPA: DUF305 domain-containing protein [Bryobacteraceae bacterium]|nr:DUF305 domain-containing protein [Bryobacteraceae bacterium]